MDRSLPSILHQTEQSLDCINKACRPMQSLNVYGSMDRVLQKNNEYAVGISMYSQRVGNSPHFSSQLTLQNLLVF
jgi:hypothetical protein